MTTFSILRRHIFFINIFVVRSLIDDDNDDQAFKRGFHYDGTAAM